MTLDDKEAAELRVLRATLARLPRTADGVPMLPGMEVFYIWRGTGIGRGSKFIPGPCVVGATVGCLERKRGGRLVAFCDESPATDEVFYADREIAEQVAKRAGRAKGMGGRALLCLPEKF